MRNSRIKCAVTGANGYVGSAITNYLRNQGVTVYELRRTSHEVKESAIRPFFLGKAISPNTFQDTDVLVHCAYDFSSLKWKDIAEVNIQGTLRVFEAAKKAGVKKIIFISTMSAFEGCRSLYGKAKHEIEKEGRKFGILIIRPGLVWGDNPGGMMGSVTKLLSVSSIVPLVGRGKQVMYLIHEDDLGELVFKVMRKGDSMAGKEIIAAHHEGKAFREILAVLGARKGKKVAFVPIPSQLIWIILKSAELVGLRPRLRSDSLISLINQNAKPDFTFTEQMDQKVREFK